METPDPARPPEPDERYLVPALIRGLGLLQAFGPGRTEMTLAELAAAIGVTRSAAYRLAYTLEHLGFLRHDPRGRRYALGPEVLRLGYGYLASRDLVEVAGPALEALRDRTGWSAHLGILEGTEVVYVARVPTRRSVASNVQLGSRLPAHATAMGRILLAALPEASSPAVTPAMRCRPSPSHFADPARATGAARHRPRQWLRRQRVRL
ncbi:IclR family transcriptional regulator [Pseudoroseomonas wenyumeiae]